MASIARHLMSWGTGSDSVGGRPLRTVLSAAGLRTAGVTGPAAFAAAIRRLTDYPAGATNEVAVLVPVDDREPIAAQLLDSRVEIVGYDGDFTDAADEIAVGDDFFLQCQSYAVTPFMSVIGPTLVRIDGIEDFEAFLTDADVAHESGEFAEHTRHPLIQLADLPALRGPAQRGSGQEGSAQSSDPARRIFVAADGALSTSPSGAVLGSFGDPLETVLSSWQQLQPADPAAADPVPLHRALPEPVRLTALRDRPWLPRYLTVLDALRHANQLGHPDTAVAGFGESADVAFSRSVADPALPVLLAGDDVNLVHDPLSGKTFAVSADTARLVGVLSVAGEEEQAVALAQSALQVAEPQVRHGLRAVVARFPALAPAGTAWTGMPS